MSTLRHRELVLSLKHSTVEACFSVPMLNLTMPNLPFLLAYLTAVLHWPAWAIGLAAALPHICNAVQPPISRGMERRWSLHTIMRWSFVLSAGPWFFVGLCAKLPGAVGHALFASLLTVATLANSISSVAWSASIAQIVPPRISGRYFGRRNLAYGAWTLIAVLAAGKIVDLAENSALAFTLIFAVAGLARLSGLFFLGKMKFPPAIYEKKNEAFAFSEVLVPLRDRNYRYYMLFVGMWGLFLNMGLPFYTVFLLRSLDFNVGHTVLFATLGTLGGIITLRSWGLLSDRFGNKPVQYVCSYAWIVAGLVGWLAASPALNNHLYLVYLVVGGATAGFQLTQFNLMLRLTPQGMGSLYVAVFLAVTSALTALGPVLGGALLAVTPDQLGVFLGQPVYKYHLLFLVSFAGCLVSMQFLGVAHEPASHGVQTVWRSMWRMRSFNPLLAMTNAATYLLTPRGIVSLGQSSVRTLRREVKRVIGVGEELVEGGQNLLKPGPDRR